MTDGSTRQTTLVTVSTVRLETSEEKPDDADDQANQGDGDKAKMDRPIRQSKPNPCYQGPEWLAQAKGAVRNLTIGNVSQA
jgi:hypothetical protein